MALLYLNIKNVITIFFFNVLILSDKSFKKIERFISWCKVNLILTPLAYLIEGIGLWLNDNHVFVTLSFVCIVINAIYGMCVHHFILKDFSWIKFFAKTIIMLTAVILTYSVLEIILILAKQSTATDLARITIQISVIIYPISKILKNIHISTGGEFPAEWLMKKIYNYNKEPNLSKLLNLNKDDESDNKISK